jgi:hypothetical protein
MRRLAAIDTHAMINSKTSPSLAALLVIPACISLLLITSCQQNPQHENTVLVMQRSVSFPGIESVSKRIREECDLAKNLSDDIQYHAKQHFPKIDLVDVVSADTTGKALFVKISMLKGGDRGSQWAGSPYMAVEGTLWSRGARIGSFIAQRQSWNTVDSCMSLARVSRALGKDIGNWLASPALDTRLGDAK